MAVFSGLGLIVEEKKASLQTMVDSNKMPIFEEEKSIKILRPIVMIKWAPLCDLCFYHPNF